ncbi:MAG: hypothetical protein ACI832_003143, partial [Rheinheimera aquimaris]
MKPDWQHYFDTAKRFIRLYAQRCQQ